MSRFNYLIFTFLITSIVSACNNKKNIEVLKKNETDVKAVDGASGVGKPAETPLETFLAFKDFINFDFNSKVDPSKLFDSSIPLNHDWFAIDDEDLCDKSQGLKFTVKDKETVILVEQTSDRTRTPECGEGGYTDQTGKLVNESVKSFKMVSCSGVDLSEFDGKIWNGNSSIFMSKEIAAKCEGAQTIKFLKNSINEDIGFLKKADFDDQGKPCVLAKKEQTYELNNCYRMVATNHPGFLLFMGSESGVSGEATSANSPGEFRLLMNYKAVNLRTDKNGTWYSQGNYEVNLNQYNGSVTYSGANISPTYRLDMGGNILSGSIDQLNADLMATWTVETMDSASGSGMALRLSSPVQKQPSINQLRHKLKRR